ncbi:proton-conducting transporter membrane subunit [Candidatus Acidulodesulfobacterium sp. H_13]|uniref:proton-conducting transporter transmembrane domain-containing protein n=1 Tax=Candidatus Acidulodesulfobacterium sp. H_13 TaxID=3395470 RepID=UPI003AF4D897
MNLSLFIVNPLNYYYLFLIFSIAGISISFLGLLSKKIKNGFVFSNILYMAASLSVVSFSITAFFKGGNFLKQTLYLGSFFPAGKVILRFDTLSDFFLMFLFGVLFYISLYQIKYVKSLGSEINRALFAFLYGIMLVSVYFVIASFNGFVFMIFWEIMAISSFFLVMTKHYIKGTTRAAFLMAVITEIGAMLIVVGLMILYLYSNNFDLNALSNIVIPGYLKEIVFILFLFGFGAKMGIVPLHIWLPEAHPASPSGVSGVLSGVLTSCGVYGIMRFGLYVLHPAGTALMLGTITLIIAAFTMFLGVLYMSQTHDIKVLLSYSTVDNMGLILTGIGASLYYKYYGLYGLSALALIASLYALINHAFFKSLLFMGAGNIEHETGSHDMDDFGGILKRMPITGILVFIGILSAAGVPPLNGFASEWLNLEMIFLGFHISSILPRILLFGTGSILALSSAVAISNYVKLYGLTFIGLPRGEKTKKAKEVPLSMNIALLIPALLSISLAGFMFLYTPIFAKVSELIYHINIGKNILHNYIFIPYYSSFSASSPVYMFFVSIVLLFILYILYRVIIRPKKRSIGYAWTGGKNVINPHTQVSTLGFSNALRIMFNLVYRQRLRLPHRKIYPLSYYHGEEYLKPDKKNISNPFPYSSYYHNSSGYGSYIFPLIEYYLYLPLIKLFEKISTVTTELMQNGSLNLYIFYIFFVFGASFFIIVLIL